MMGRKRKYRLYLLAALAVDLLVLAFFVWGWIQESIPDQISVNVGQELEIDYQLPVTVSSTVEDCQVIRVNTQPLSKNELTLDLSQPFSLQIDAEGSYEVALKFMGMTFKNVSVDVVDETYVMPVGVPTGLYIHTKGVMVLGTGKVTDVNGTVSEPAKTIFKSGDYILDINGTSIRNTSQALSLIQSGGGGKLTFSVLRDGKEIQLKMNPVKTSEDVYKVGIWLRDDTQGIGTITYVDANQQFAALGHGITDIDTGLLIDISHGMVYRSNILSVVKGESGTPGEIVGTIDYQRNDRIGTISSNTNCGIFGYMDPKMLSYDQEKAVPVAHKQEVQEGEAQILCAIDGEAALYDVRIEKIDYGNSDNKNFVIRITDDRLLQKTNGILQGMSGSPILQNGKLAGAVTHVLVNDPTRGYGIFIENMLDAAS
ncbi:MAG: SpoIVB peptidase [Coprococcus sp.]